EQERKGHEGDGEPAQKELAHRAIVARMGTARGPPSVRIVLQEREVALRQVVELERAAAARALEGRRLEVGGEDRRGLDQTLLLMSAADAVERRKERRHG